MEHRRLGRPRRVPIVMDRDRMQELRSHVGVQRRSTLLDQAQAQVDVAEEASFLGRPKRRRSPQLADPTDVVQQRRGEQQVGAKPRVQLRRLPREGGHAHRVLEQPAGIRVMALRSGQRPQRSPHGRILGEGADETGEPGVRELGREKVEESVELVRIAPQARRQLDGVGLRRLHRPHLELQPLAEARDPAEHPHRVPFGEARVQQLDVVPDTCVDSPGGVDELEREIRRALLRPQPLLARDSVDPLDDAILRQLRDAAHERSLESAVMNVRAAQPSDADAIADVFIDSFESLTFLPRLHTHAEHRAFIRDHVLVEQEVWVAEHEGRILGFAALSEDMLSHLYVHTESQGAGAGTALLATAKERRPDGFTFWVFQQNERARAFYERRGCTVVRLTDGAENEEKTPDALYEWRPRGGC
jgi:ribosomal protein S18 acetylase RimI-like enzyme